MCRFVAVLFAADYLSNYYETNRSEWLKPFGAAHSFANTQPDVKAVFRNIPWY